MLDLVQLIEQLNEISGHIAKVLSDADGILSDDDRKLVVMIQDSAVRTHSSLRNVTDEIQIQQTDSLELQAMLMSDLRNPVSVILNASTMLLEFTSDSTKLSEQQQMNIAAIGNIGQGILENFNNTLDQLRKMQGTDQDNPA